MKKIVLTWLALSAASVGAWQLQTLGIPQFKSLHVERLLVSPRTKYLFEHHSGRQFRRVLI